jgi:HEAT repeat protein
VLPFLPFDILLPLALGAAALCLGLMGVIIGRRLLEAWTNQDEQLVRHAVTLLRLDYVAESIDDTELLLWLGRDRPARIESLIAAVERLESEIVDIREWLSEETRLGARLAELALAPPRRVWWPGRVSRWTRVSAVRALGLLRLPGSLPVLGQALDDADPEVAHAAAEALGRLDARAADALLQRIAVVQRVNNSRLAAVLETMTGDLTDDFRRHLDRDDVQVHYWIATLIGQRQMPELVLNVRPLLDSPDPNVRAAACECLGQLRVPLTDRWLATRLHDDVWYVQSNTARALGALGAAWAVDDLARMLTSREWWVRQAAADALVALGGPALEPVVRVLEAPDRFGRNNAVEVLERMGWVGTVLERVAYGDPCGEEQLRRFGESGGIGYLENALFSAPEAAVPALLGVLRQLGDDATYGRLRAAAEQMADHLRPMVYDVALAVRGR